MPNPRYIVRGREVPWETARYHFLPDYPELLETMQNQENFERLIGIDRTIKNLEVAAGGLQGALKEVRQDLEVVGQSLALGPVEEPPGEVHEVPEVIKEVPAPPVVVTMGQEGFTSTLYIKETMSLQENLAVIAGAPQGSLIHVEGTIPWLYLGGDKKRGAYHADGSPISHLTFQGSNLGDSRMSLRFKDEFGGYGDLDFRNLNFTPGTADHKACVMVEQGVLGGHLGFYHCKTNSPYASWDGFGMKWGFVLRGNSWTIEDCIFDPAKEHSWYDHNGQGDRVIRRSYNTTRVMTDVLGFQRVMGNGRTFGQFQERTEDGPESFGTVLVEDCTANYCGHEGLLQGQSQATGGACLTVGGNKDQVTFRDITINYPYCNSVAVWTELYSDTHLPKGYRVPGVGPVLLENIQTVTPSDSPRKTFVLGGCESLEADSIHIRVQSPTPIPYNDTEVKWNGDSQHGIPDIPLVVWDGQTVTP